MAAELEEAAAHYERAAALQPAPACGESRATQDKRPGAATRQTLCKAVAVLSDVRLSSVPVQPRIAVLLCEPWSTHTSVTRTAGAVGSRMRSARTHRLPELPMHTPGAQEGLPLLCGSVARRSEQPLSSQEL